MFLTPSNKRIVLHPACSYITVDVIFSHGRQVILPSHSRRAVWLRSPKSISQKGREGLRKNTSFPFLWLPYLVVAGGIVAVSVTFACHALAIDHTTTLTVIVRMHGELQRSYISSEQLQILQCCTR